MMPVSFLTAIQMILPLYPGLEIIPGGHLQLWDLSVTIGCYAIALQVEPTF